MELEIYSGGNLYASESLDSGSEVMVSFDSQNLYFGEIDMGIGPGTSIERIYGENVRECSTYKGKYEMDTPLRIDTCFISDIKANEGWTKYSFNVDTTFQTLGAEITLDPLNANSYIERIKEFEQSGDLEIGEDLLNDFVENDDVQILSITVGADITEYVREGPVYVSIV